MTKKKEDVLEPSKEAIEQFIDEHQLAADRDARDIRYVSLENALTFHKTNGGMLTAQQLIENAKQFQTYLSGESK